MENQNILSLDDIYFKDAFTETEDGINIEANRLKVNCITSKNNKFHLDNEGNLSVNSITTTENSGGLDKNEICSFIYPVGSIYISINNTNPTTLFGGTWQALQDRFLLGAGYTYAGGATGGEQNHVLTQNEMPGHNHTMNNSGDHTHGIQGYWRSYSSATTAKVLSYDRITSDAASTYTPILSAGDHSHYVNAAGGSAAHNNMPPYLAVYMWKRTA